MLGACDTPSTTDDDASIAGPFVPGISGGPLANRLEVVVVDELTREPIEATITIESDGLERAVGPSPLVHESTEPLDAADVTASIEASGHTTLIRWIGVRGARAVIPAPRRDASRTTVDVRGTLPSGASALEVTALAPLHILRSDGVGAASSTCASLDACSATIDVPAGASALVATAIDARGAPLAFAIAGVEGRTIDFDLGARATVAIDAPLPGPGPGLDAVVGVPGLTEERSIARLPRASGSSFVVPVLDGEPPGATWWLLARAEGVDRSSTVVQRDLQQPTDAGAWPSFLAAPELVTTASAISASPPPGATLLVVERLDATREESSLFFELPAQIELEPPSTGGRVFVRAIDAGSVDASAVDLDAIEAATVRWSEATRM